MGLTRREFLWGATAMAGLGLFSCATQTPTTAPTPTRTPTPTPTPVPPPDILLKESAEANSQLIQGHIALFSDLASQKRKVLRVGAGGAVYRLSVITLPNPGPALVIRQERTGEQKTLFLKERTVQLAGPGGKVERESQLALPELGDLLKRVRERLRAGESLEELLKKIAQEELFRTGITVAAIALGVWLLASLGAALLSAFAGIAFIVLVLALLVAGAGAIKRLLEEAGITTEDIKRFLREGIEQIRRFLEAAEDALRTMTK